VATLGDDLTGLLLGGRYRITRLIGRGGMGAVFVAHDEKLGSDVAVKVVREALLDDHAALERFKRESRLLPELVHEHIVRAYGAGDDNGLLWIAMELLEGTTLRVRIEERGRMPWRESLPIVRQIAAALDAAHERGVIHRDLKPDNVMFVGASSKTEAPPDIRLLDFGVAKGIVREGSAASMTGTGMMIGTPGYIAPEVIVEGRSDDPRSDLYALGVLWFELVTGARPFTAKTPVALAMAHAHQAAPSPSTLLPFHPLPAPVDRLIMRLMAKTPDERPATAHDLITLLDRIEGEATLAEQQPTPVELAQASFPTVTDMTATPKFTPGPMSAVNPPSHDATARQPTPATAGFAPTRLERVPAATAMTPPPTSGVHVSPKLFAAGVAGAAVLAAGLVVVVLAVTAKDDPLTPPPAPAAPQQPGTVDADRKATPDGRPVLIAAAAAETADEQADSKGAGAAPGGLALSANSIQGDRAEQAVRVQSAEQAALVESKAKQVKSDASAQTGRRSDAVAVQAAPPPQALGKLMIQAFPKKILKDLLLDKTLRILPMPQTAIPAGQHRAVVTVGGQRVEHVVDVKPGESVDLCLDAYTGARITCP
jgi:serine/threonine protein kinase